MEFPGKNTGVGCHFLLQGSSKPRDQTHISCIAGTFFFLPLSHQGSPNRTMYRAEDGETMETVTDFIFLISKVTADGDCSHEIKRHLFLGRKAMNNIDNILKSRDVTLPTKVLLVKAMVFPIVIYGCESWTLKKAESQRIILLNCGVGEDS